MTTFDFLLRRTPQKSRRHCLFCNEKNAHIRFGFWHCPRARHSTSPVPSSKLFVFTLENLRAYPRNRREIFIPDNNNNDDDDDERKKKQIKIRQPALSSSPLNASTNGNDKGNFSSNYKELQKREGRENHRSSARLKTSEPGDKRPRQFNVLPSQLITILLHFFSHFYKNISHALMHSVQV